MDIVSSLPPEIKLQIFNEVALDPRSIPVSAILLPFTRLAAYRDIKVESEASFVKLGESLERSPFLRNLVEHISIDCKESILGSEQDWKAFNHLDRVESIAIKHRAVDEFLSTVSAALPARA